MTTIINEESRLIKVNNAPKNRPDETISNQDDLNDPPNFVPPNTKGSDGIAITDAEITNPNLQTNHKGMYALEEVDTFNLLCIPPLEREKDGDTNLGRVTKFCKDHRAIFIMDPPLTWDNVEFVKNDIKNNLSQTIGDFRDHTAVYFPRIKVTDPLQENQLNSFGPCGAVAGIIARIDSQRGVWKAPAGIEASFLNVRELTYQLTNNPSGQLNSLGINCIRKFAQIGTVIWGARTLDGADIFGSEWKYLSVRRLALYIEESICRGIEWVALKPNGESLWSQIRLEVGAFIHNLFRQGAFQGSSPKDAYFVKCDKDTTTQADIDQGVVNITVGFAPLKPAEFVIIRIQQTAGQI
jgi:phage tail sheath protein FI